MATLGVDRGINFEPLGFLTGVVGVWRLEQIYTDQLNRSPLSISPNCLYDRVDCVWPKSVMLCYQKKLSFGMNHLELPTHWFLQDEDLLPSQTYPGTPIRVHIISVQWWQYDGLWKDFFVKKCPCPSWSVLPVALLQSPPSLSAEVRRSTSRRLSDVLAISGPAILLDRLICSLTGSATLLRCCRSRGVTGVWRWNDKQQIIPIIQAKKSRFSKHKSINSGESSNQKHQQDFHLFRSLRQQSLHIQEISKKPIRLWPTYK